jgi:pimeloyl-ACP methyl ester carboxylesterase
LSRGWPVYVVDQPGKGRSGYFPRAYGEQERDPSRKQIVERFTASEKVTPLPWPTAKLHTQWPQTGLPGDPVFEQFFASEVANMPDVDMQYALTTKAVTELLAKIGPAIIVTHSQAGPLSWMIAQANRGKVKAIIAVEPTGNANRDGKGPATPCGITDACLDFMPALPDAASLGMTRTPVAQAMGVDCWLQPTERYKLPWLAGTPILIATGEASYHAGQDYCTSAFLKQAGVPNDYVYLPTRGHPRQRAYADAREEQSADRRLLREMAAATVAVGAGKLRQMCRRHRCHKSPTARIRVEKPRHRLGPAREGGWQ